MSVQEHEATRDPFSHSTASETIPSDVPVTSVEPEASAQTMPMRRITSKRPPNLRNVLEVTMLGILQFFPPIIIIWKRCQKFRNVGRVSSVELDSAWLAIEIEVKTPKSETLTVR